MAILRAAAHQGMSWITGILAHSNYLVAEILAAFLVLYATWRIVYSLYFAPLSKIPGSRISKLTNAKSKFNALFGRLGDTCEDEYYKYGDIYVVGPRTVVISNPADCKTVFGSHRFIKAGTYRHFAVIADVMFTTQSAELTHVRRRQVGPAFTHGYLNGMEPTILECGILAIKQKWDALIDGSGTGEATIPYALHFSLTTFDIIGALGYGQRFNALKDNSGKIVDWVYNFIRLGLLGIVFPNTDWFPLSLLKKPLEKSKDEFVAFGNAAADRRREMLRYGKMEKPKDILQAMIDAEDPKSHVRMTQRQITAETIGFLIAGTDTTSLTMSWTLHYLLLYPEAYARAVREVRSRFPREHTITYAEGKAELPFVDACIYESMRIRAVSGVFLPRIVPEGGATFQGHYLPAGTRIGVNIAGANHHRETWEQPRRFMPERFLGEGEKRKQNVITFSSGVRICPGRNLALYEMMTILANLLKDYDFSLPANALFRPDKVDKDGNPIAMPRTQSLTVLPKHPERDCLVVVKRAPDSSFSNGHV
ncbi:hypothetical protein IW140_005815 [Coemansia sp. RSA 1813]|nr:hypothetical protein EV178_003900 [Coemansia sp. RSA 1646]KAJ1770447.1 hypothetical protein LPJ74_003182 [Coemansia sp. RSA 1843]KAJ2090239.1 hypothetical protein IW138_002871 [Coemansia sp. RSA 986]KAJ2212575.1 hypothetical protein EV179_004557 [Coemansia sp. RSA 487]KAJ2564257.1 hypothetical protein IW140_005815 [Coemansia sp. RSA 1813]